jgi:hypothetical protein
MSLDRKLANEAAESRAKEAEARRLLGEAGLVMPAELSLHLEYHGFVGRYRLLNRAFQLVFEGDADELVEWVRERAR